MLLGHGKVSSIEECVTRISLFLKILVALKICNPLIENPIREF